MAPRSAEAACGLRNALARRRDFARGGAERRNMKLLPLDKPELFERVASWLAQKENYQWLDFGNGRQPVTPALLKIMAQRETHFLRVFLRVNTSDREDAPIGILGL